MHTRDKNHTKRLEPGVRDKSRESAMTTSNASVASVAYNGSDRGWPELPEAALYGLAGDVVRTIEPHSEADPAAILVQFLVAVGNAIGPGIHCAVESTRHGLNLFACIVGDTSKSRKGTSWDHIKLLFSTVFPKWVEKRITNGLSSAEGLIAEVQDSPEGTRHRRLLVVETEFAGVLRILERIGNTLSPILRAAWDSGDLGTLVKNNPVRATGAHISIVGHITRSELRRYLTRIEAHNGFANRLLFVCVRRSKFLPEGGRVPTDAIASIAERLEAVGIWARNVGAFEIKRDERARELWAEAYRKLSEGKFGLVGAATGRAEAQVLRLAALFAVLDCSKRVRIEHLRAALALWDYCRASAEYIFCDVVAEGIAGRIQDALEGAGAVGLTKSQIRDLFYRHAPTHEIDEALARLQSSQSIHIREVRTNGRSKTVWSAKMPDVRRL